MPSNIALKAEDALTVIGRRQQLAVHRNLANGSVGMRMTNLG